MLRVDEVIEWMAAQVRCRPICDLGECPLSAAVWG